MYTQSDLEENVKTEEHIFIERKKEITDTNFILKQNWDFQNLDEVFVFLSRIAEAWSTYYEV